MTEELRLGLKGRELVFPDGKAFCLVCGAAPAGTRRVWFEDMGSAGLAASGEIGSTRHALGTGARVIASRIEFQAPLCGPHKTRAIRTGLGAIACMLLGVGVLVLGNVVLSRFKILRKYEDFSRWIPFIPALVPAGFGYVFWRRKDRGGLPCEARRDEEDLVLTYPDRAPEARARD
jgi:hypothetical protein